MEVHVVDFTRDKQAKILQSMYQCRGKRWDSGGKITAEQLKSITTNVVDKKHHSLLESVDTKIKVSHVSRAFLAQLTRHRLFSFWVESQRAVEPQGCVLPPPGKYKDNLVNRILVNYFRCMTDYQWLVARGMEKEDARAVLPASIETSLLIKGNDRVWMDFLNKRLCRHAQYEIRQFAVKVKELMQDLLPEVFKFVGCSQCKENCEKGVI